MLQAVGRTALLVRPRISRAGTEFSNDEPVRFSGGFPSCRTSEIGWLVGK
jgi:hypothetical protein